MSVKSPKKASKPKPKQPLNGPTGELRFQHRSGKQVVPPHLVDEVAKTVLLDQKTGSNTILARAEILDRLSNLGWPEAVKVTSSSEITVTSIKEKTALCLQTGNTGRMYADMLKLQKLYLKQTITAGIIISATKRLSRVWGRSDANLVNTERMVDELKQFSDIITVPLIIIGIATPEDLPLKP